MSETNPVGYTATIVAAKRVLEQHNPQPLVTDAYAPRLVGSEPQYLLEKWQKVAQQQGIPWEEVLAKRTRYVAVRTRFFDQAIQSFVQEQGSAQPPIVPQVVLLGAGLDTRALRLPELARACCYEVDRPEILHHKHHCLQDLPQPCQPQGTLHRIAADLTQPHQWLPALENCGWSRQNPTFWLLEGVVMYLPALAASQLVQRLRAVSGAGSVLGLDGVRSGSIQAAQRLRHQERGRVVRHWQFGHDRPQDWLQAEGWNAQVFRPGELAWARSRYPAKLPESPEMGGYGTDRGVWLAIAPQN